MGISITSLHSAVTTSLVVTIASCAPCFMDMADASVSSCIFAGRHPLTFVHPSSTMINIRGGMPKGQIEKCQFYEKDSHRLDFSSAFPSRLGSHIQSEGEPYSSTLRPRKQVQFIAKTVESFKLADLYWLEACVMSYCQRREMQNEYQTQSIEKGTVSRLAFHRPTASYLLGHNVDTENTRNFQTNNSASLSSHDKLQGESNRNIDDMTIQTIEMSLPFRPCRFQYAARVIASGQTPSELLDNIHQIFLNTAGGEKSWIIDYDTLEPLSNPKNPKKTFSSTMLMCAVSRVVPGEPSLISAHDPREHHDDISSYVIVETASRLYLAQKVSYDGIESNRYGSSYPQLDSENSIANEFRALWSRRSFQYSGAINLDVALTVVDILGDMLQRKDHSSPVRILDPTCGSGTFLALALMGWGNNFIVEGTGIDSNSKCAQGTVNNLKHLFPHAIDDCDGNGNDCWKLKLDSNNSLRSRATIYSEDSTQLPSLALDKFDCAVANLPWNRNTFEFHGTNDANSCTNTDILKASAGALKPGSPFVIISSGDRNEQSGQSNNKNQDTAFNARTVLESIGFCVLGEATIPPKGFNLPMGKKMVMTTKNKKKVKRSSDCLITVAVAP
mmetsp:Transcript_28787/g.60777  ORF Transcript_28787/g.60777 Transcript_28787/m.60777 type:complete len:615 (-) Transcript_28787:41-1885(-)